LLMSLPRLGAGGLLSGCPRRKATKAEKRAILSTKSPLGRTKGVGLGLGSLGRLRGSAGPSIFGGRRGLGVGEWADRLEDKVRRWDAGELPAGERGIHIIGWLADLPSPLRRSIFMLLRGYEEEGRKGRAQGAAKRKKAGAASETVMAAIQRRRA
jgi:hypothetical protein